MRKLAAVLASLCFLAALGLCVSDISRNQSVPDRTLAVVEEDPAPQLERDGTEPEDDEAMVWISGTGKRYHSSPECSNMREPSHVPLSDAIDMGRTPCSKCYREP